MKKQEIKELREKLLNEIDKKDCHIYEHIANLRNEIDEKYSKFFKENGFCLTTEFFEMAENIYTGLEIKAYIHEMELDDQQTEIFLGNIDLYNNDIYYINQYDLLEMSSIEVLKCYLKEAIINIFDNIKENN